MKTRLYLSFLGLMVLAATIWAQYYKHQLTQQSDVVEVLPAEPIPREEGRFIHSSFISDTKGKVDYCAYLPPGWSQEDTTTYPLLIYLYGQGGDEYSFARVVKPSQLDDWIHEGLIEPLVIITVRGAEILPGEAWHKQKIQWYTSANEKLLLSEKEGELRHFVRTKFRAGMTSSQIGLEGQSRGASGTLHYALKHPEKFSSFIANAYVSDYTLESLKSKAKRNRKRLQNIKLRMEIGTKDYFVKRYKRKGSQRLHQYLTDLKIPHEYDTLSGRSHGFRQFWYHPREGYANNGLFHLLYHQTAWKSARVAAEAN